MTPTYKLDVTGDTRRSGFDINTSSAVVIADSGDGSPVAYTLEPVTIGNGRYLFTCNDTDTCDVTMDADKTVTARIFLRAND